jgi:hypothetical protein
LLFPLSLKAQTFDFKELCTIAASRPDELDKFLQLKGYKNLGLQNNPDNNGIEELWIHTSNTDRSKYNQVTIDYEGRKTEEQPISILYQTNSEDAYLKLKNELKVRGFQYSDYVQDGQQMRSYVVSGLESLLLYSESLVKNGSRREIYNVIVSSK